MAAFLVLVYWLAARFDYSLEWSDERYVNSYAQMCWGQNVHDTMRSSSADCTSPLVSDDPLNHAC